MKKLLLVTLLSSLIANPSFADSAKSAANQALKLYQQGKYSEAASQWDAAATYARQLQAKASSKVLPEPLKGWTLSEETADGLAGSMMGGGTSINREYTKGEASVVINMVSDNPMIQGAAMLFKNPSFAAMSGVKQKTIKGRTAMLQDEAGGKQLLFLLRNNSTLITIAATGSKDDVATAEAYAKAIDFDAIDKM